MRTYVRVTGRDDPACRRRRVLRVGGAARRSTPARAARDRRRRGRARSQLRGESLRRPDRDERRTGPPAVPTGDRRRRPGSPPTPRRARRCSACSTTRARWSKGSRSTRRSSMSAGCGDCRARPVEIAIAPAARRPRSGRPADHGRGREDEVPRQGCERRRQARRPARRAARSRARLPAPAPGRAALGCRAGDRRQAPRPRDRDRRRGRAACRRRCSCRCSAAPPAGTSTHWPTTATPGRSSGPPARLDRVAACARPLAEDARRNRCRGGRAWSTASRAGCGQRAASAAPSCSACGSTTSHGRRDRTRFRTRPRRPRRSSTRRGHSWRPSMPMIERAGPHARRRGRRRTSTTPTPSSSRCRSIAHGSDALDAALDEVRDRFGTAAITRAVLLGRDPGWTMPLLPD